MTIECVINLQVMSAKNKNAKFAWRMYYKLKEELKELQSKYNFMKETFEDQMKIAATFFKTTEEPISERMKIQKMVALMMRMQSELQLFACYVCGRHKIDYIWTECCEEHMGAECYDLCKKGDGICLECGEYMK